MSDTVLGWLFGGWSFRGRETPAPRSRANEPHAPDTRANVPNAGTGAERTEDPLAAAICAGNERAFQQLFNARYHGLVAMAQGYLGDRAAAEDIVQEIMWDLWNRRTQLDATRPFEPYLFRAVRYAAQRHRRRERLAEQYAFGARSDPLTPVAMAPGEMTEDDLVEQAQAVLATLPSRDQEVLDLRLQGLTFAEVGVILGLPLKTVATRTSRAIARLRRVLLEQE